MTDGYSGAGTRAGWRGAHRVWLNRPSSAHVLPLGRGRGGPVQPSLRLLDSLLGGDADEHVPGEQGGGIHQRGMD